MYLDIDFTTMYASQLITISYDVVGTIWRDLPNQVKVRQLRVVEPHIVTADIITWDIRTAPDNNRAQPLDSDGRRKTRYVCKR